MRTDILGILMMGRAVARGEGGKIEGRRGEGEGGKLTM